MIQTQIQTQTITFEAFAGALRNRMSSLFQDQTLRGPFVINAEGLEIWETFINAFAPEKQQEYTCSACRHYLKNYGGIVFLDPNYSIVTPWDIQIGSYYQGVADALSGFVKARAIAKPFYTQESSLGVESNLERLESGQTIRWHHFSYKLDRQNRSRLPRSEDHTRELVDSFRVFRRTLQEIKSQSTETLLELIDQGSVYRGAEYRSSLESLLTHQRAIADLSGQSLENYCWSCLSDSTAILRLRNTAIGTLLVDIEESVELDRALKKFEAIMAPQNYKRPTAVFTARQVEAAEQTLKAEGLLESLERRHANLDDIPLANILHLKVEELRARTQDPFALLKREATPKPQTLQRVEEVTLETFVRDILPGVQTVEVLFESHHIPNMVSLIGPQHPEARNILKWQNPFSWCYNSGTTDSVKEKVKAAGGQVEGILRNSLEWYNTDDLDQHLQEPGGFEISYSSKRSPTGGNLDVDMNVSLLTTEPVENIIYPYGSKPKTGLHRLWVHQFRKRNDENPGFSVEIEIGNEIYTFGYPKPLRQNETVEVATYRYSPEKGFHDVQSSLEKTVRGKEVWGLKTGQFYTVSCILPSPNFWSEHVGNQHLFFMLEEARNPEPCRGLFNEFLREDLVQQHRKVLEALGAKTKVQPAERQLSGLGFSSTLRNTLTVKVSGKFTRTIKINL
jgi:hypothetical protein